MLLFKYRECCYCNFLSFLSLPPCLDVFPSPFLSLSLSQELYVPLPRSTLSSWQILQFPFHLHIDAIRNCFVGGFKVILYKQDILSCCLHYFFSLKMSFLSIPIHIDWSLSFELLLITALYACTIVLFINSPLDGICVAFHFLLLQTILP